MPTAALSIDFDAPIIKDLVGLLARDLCEQRGLPPELALSISRYLDEVDIVKTSKLSKNLHERANAILYHHVKIDPSSFSSSDDSVVLLLRTLVTSTTAANWIRRFSLAGDPLQQWRMEVRRGESVEEAFKSHPIKQIYLSLNAFKRRELEDYSTKSVTHSAPNTDAIPSVALPCLCADIIALATDLEQINIRSDYFRYAKFRDALGDIVGSGGLKMLRSCNLCSDLVRGACRHMGATRHWDSSLLTFFSAPGIESMTTVMTLSPGISMSCMSSLTRLSFDHYQVQDFDLNRLFAATPKLSSLEYNAWVDWSWWPDSRHPNRRHAVGLEPLFDALRHVEGTLEELITTVNFTEDSPHFDDMLVAGRKPLFAPIDDRITHLTHLRTLSVPWIYLLGESQTDNFVKDWDSLLPPSMRRITWTDHLSDSLAADDWTDEGLIPVITSLLDWLKKHRPTEGSAEFGLLLLRSASQFNEPIRQTLSQLCQTRGLSCSIQKNTSDRPKSPPRQPVSRGRARGRGGTVNRGRGT